MNQSNQIVSEFFRLAMEAGRIDASLDHPIEPSLESILLHVLAHPEARQELTLAFLEIAHDAAKGPSELVGYCMHTLRWSEVKQELNTWLLNESSERVRHILRSMLASFEDDWYDADLYEKYSKH